MPLVSLILLSARRSIFTPRLRRGVNGYATLLRRQERLPGLIEHLRPGWCQLPIHATIARAMVEIYRLRGCVEGREFVMRLKSDESHLANWQ